MASGAKKIAVGTSIGVVIIIAIMVVYNPMFAATQPSSKSGSDVAKTDVTVTLPDNSEVELTVDRPAIWKHERVRDFDEDSFTIKVAKTLSSSGSLSSYSIVPFSASIHITNHYMQEYTTVNQWQNFTNADDWVTASFADLNDGDTLFVTVYENDAPVLNLMESGRQ